MRLNPAATAKNGLKRIACHFGLEVTQRRVNPERSWERFLVECTPDLVIDIGANVGQWATKARAAGYRGPLLSVEPLTAAYIQLHTAAASDPQWTVVKAAVGDAEQQGEIHVSGNSFSSSLLPMLTAHISEAPDSKPETSEFVDVRPLDQICADSTFERAYMKIDTQGYELKCLQSGPTTLSQCLAVELELSLAPLYEDAPSHVELTHLMEASGFLPIMMFPIFWASTHPQLLQMDVVFARSEYIVDRGWPLPFALSGS